MAEEVHNPSEVLPKAISWSVPIGTLFGLVFLLPLVFTLPDVSTLLAGEAFAEVSFRFTSDVASSCFGSTHRCHVRVDYGQQSWWLWNSEYHL